MKNPAAMPIDGLALGAALISGLAGSVHCVAMCGGIATGLGSLAGQGRPGFGAALRINGGRIAGYVLAGVVVGSVGHGLLALAPQLGLALRVALGAALVLIALRLLDSGRRLAMLHKSGTALWQWLAPLRRRLLPANTPTRQLGLGMLWGWMPCGLSSAMLFAAWLQADVLQSALLMLAFGLGTLPPMLPLSYSGLRLGGLFARPGLRRAGGVLVLLSGVLTMAAPWLMHSPLLQPLLAGLGCH